MTEKQGESILFNKIQKAMHREIVYLKIEISNKDLRLVRFLQDVVISDESGRTFDAGVPWFDPSVKRGGRSVRTSFSLVNTGRTKYRLLPMRCELIAGRKRFTAADQV